MNSIHPKHAKTLVDRVGKCVEVAASMSFFNRPMHLIEISVRVIPTFDERVLLYRALGPCTCVLGRNQHYCNDCPVPDTPEAEELDAQTCVFFVRLLRRWPEYIGNITNPLVLFLGHGVGGT